MQCVCHVHFLPLTAGGPGEGVTGAGIGGGDSVFTSSFSLSGSSSSTRGGGAGAKLGHRPISAFSKDTGWEKSERLHEGEVIRFKITTCLSDIAAAKMVQILTLVTPEESKMIKKLVKISENVKCDY